ncbi:MAG TPA: adenylate/guanylate cyclase domain-containing protein, partial [Alphaproteobacteria bacterium]|nr:adenylate/guanylate cyclase domain-containing protein [Alphaproteobacteria bacterium]
MAPKKRDSEVNYEVLTEQQGRWEIHAHYPKDKKAIAMADAESLEGISTIAAVKVVLEEYDAKTGESIETVIYPKPKEPDQPKHIKVVKSKKAVKLSKAAKSAKTKKNNAAPKKAAGEPRTAPASRKKTSRAGLFARLVIAIVISFAAAALVTGMAIPFLRDMPLTSQMQTTALFATFIVVFLGSSIPMITSIMAKSRLEVRPRQAPPAPPQAGPAEAPRQVLKDDFLPAAETVQTDPEPAVEKGAGMMDVKDGITPPDDDTPLSPHALKQQELVASFLEDGLRDAAIDVDKLDTFNKFGINLYLAGACDEICKKRHLDHRSASQILAGATGKIGYGKVEAEKFAEKYENYLIDDTRYMHMFQAGHNAMTDQLDEKKGTPPGPGKHLQEALLEWNKPKDKDERKGPITIMFTDMGGSTKPAKTRGDAVARQIVRAHNHIVREALKRCSGTEVKHTGDGIMASFTNSSNAVEAAIDIQTGAAFHNRDSPEPPLKIKIGINTGEPIAEDDDIFGSTIQLAAHIVDKAGADQIFVSEVVHGICAGR